MAKKVIAPFDGFSKETITFFSNLEKNNSKQWFDANRDTYETEVKARAESFVVAMGDTLKEISPRVNAEPRVNRSIFKINRDVRFSKDKTPYKTHMAIIFWEGGGRMDSPSYYFHLSPGRLFLGMGLYRFNKEQLQAYRESIVHDKHGAEFEKIVKKLEKKGYELEGKKYKRTPRDFDPEHPRAEYLLYGGIHVGLGEKVPQEVFSKKLTTYCKKQYSDMLELQQWLVRLAQRVK